MHDKVWSGEAENAQLTLRARGRATAAACVADGDAWPQSVTLYEYVCWCPGACAAMHAGTAQLCWGFVITYSSYAGRIRYI